MRDERLNWPERRRDCGEAVRGLEGRAVSEGSETENRGKQLIAVCGEQERGAGDFEVWGGLRE